jgi:GWxTD domain-containing protein
MKKLYWATIFAVLALWTSCRLYNLERKLGPEDRDFVSKVQYIMTGEERKIFLELPDAEKAKFKEEFWKRRDPDPATEENEYEAEYFKRVDHSGEIFHGEGRPGWLTDRGRIYILFGPPSERLTYPMDAGGYCREIWYYGGFPVIFIDEHCSGNFAMTAINLEHLQELNIAQAYFQKTFTQEKKFFDYDVVIRKKTSGGDRYEGTIVIDVPYRGLWFIARNGKLGTTLDVQAELKTVSGAVFWSDRKAFEISAGEDELKARREESYKIEFPIVLEGNLDALRQGKNMLGLTIKNSTEDEELKKAIEFRLD